MDRLLNSPARQMGNAGRFVGRGWEGGQWVDSGKFREGKIFASHHWIGQSLWVGVKVGEWMRQSLWVGE